MNRTLLTLTMVLASSVCSQSFGFDLLDRMLGMRGCGSASSCCDIGCPPPCDPGCGVEVACDPCAAAPGCCPEPACGCEVACDPCHAGPACGCEVACDPCACPPSHCGKRGGLLSKLFSHRKRSCCDAAVCEPACGLEVACGPCGAAPGCCPEPACGCEVACDPCHAAPVCGCEAVTCDSCCAPKRNRGLLSRLFGNLHRKSCCDAGCDVGCDPCGCGVSNGHGHEPSAAPMPPAPVVDPSASVSGKRRVIQASAVYVR